MKEKLFYFIAGLLLGAIICTGAIYVYTVAESKNQPNEQMPGGNFNGRGPGNDMGNPPAMPNNQFN